MPAFAGVLAIESFISGLKFKNSTIGNNSEDDVYPSFNKVHLNISKILAGINWLLLQVGIGFYQGVFFYDLQFNFIVCNFYFLILLSAE